MAINPHYIQCNSMQEQVEHMISDLKSSGLKGKAKKKKKKLIKELNTVLEELDELLEGTPMTTNVDSDFGNDAEEDSDDSDDWWK